MPRACQVPLSGCSGALGIINLCSNIICKQMILFFLSSWSINHKSIARVSEWACKQEFKRLKVICCYSWKESSLTSILYRWENCSVEGLSPLPKVRELWSVGAGTRITSSFPELVSTVNAPGLHTGTWRKRVARAGRKKCFELPSGSKRLFRSDFCWREWECCPGSLLCRELLHTNPNCGQGSAALRQPGGSGQAQESFSAVQASGDSTYAQGREHPWGRLQCQQQCPPWSWRAVGLRQSVIYQLVEMLIFNNQTMVPANTAALNQSCICLFQMKYS